MFEEKLWDAQSITAKMAHEFTVEVNDAVENMMFNTINTIYEEDVKFKTQISMNRKWVAEALIEKREREENKPLTPWKLAEMKGKPIWVNWKNRKHPGRYFILEQVDDFLISGNTDCFVYDESIFSFHKYELKGK